MTELTKKLWDDNRPPQNPFLNFNFLNALIESGSLGPATGWTPNIIQNGDSGILFSFIKNHSYGEYIFDWGWAEAYQKHGISYYPKLTSMIPFTPVTTEHFMLKNFSNELAISLLKKHDDFYENGDFSSSHFLFLSPQEINIFQSQGYMIRESLQYHFFNRQYKSFEDFLSSIKNKKAKNIKKERHFPKITIKKYTSNNLSAKHAEQMYQFYISTIINKNSHDYLTKEFFIMIFENMKDNILYIEASEDQKLIAGSLFFYDKFKLYGRYWGSNVHVHNLHFELCYYQGIDFCIENKIDVFEAGAQGEHKIARGFQPVRTYSAHKLKHPGFNLAISEFIEREKEHITQLIVELSGQLPFK
jgi:predicted N-acyltransferase